MSDEVEKHYKRRSIKSTASAMANHAYVKQKAQEPNITLCECEMKPEDLSDLQLLRKLCRTQLCEVCQMRCRYGDELQKRGLDSRLKNEV